MAHPPIGIDLGTTYSAVATIDEKGEPRLLPNAEGNYLTPSVIFFEENNSIVVGEVAKDARVDAPERVMEFVKRSMGTERKFHYVGREFDATILSAIILDKLKLDAEAVIGQSITEAVITVPAYFGAEKRDATEKAAEMVGISVLALINEPTAAALSFGMGGDKTGTVLVFDLGGGTFDATIIQFREDNVIEVLATDGDHELGGKDFDDEITKIVIEQFKQTYSLDIANDNEILAELRQKAEKAKHDLTARESTNLTIAAGGNRLKMQLTREQFAQAIRPYLEGIKITLHNVLDDAGITVNDVTDVLMVGGSSRVQAVRNMITEFFDKEPNTTVHPDEAVALGASLFAVKLLLVKTGGLIVPQVRQRAKTLPTVLDIVPHSIGVTVVDDDNQKYNSIILPRGSQLPAKSQDTFYTTYDGQTAVKVDVNEGEDEELDFVRQLGDFVLHLPEPRPKSSPIEVEASLDVSGIIRVLATDAKSSQSQDIVINYQSSLSDKQVREQAAWLEQQKIS